MMLEDISVLVLDHAQISLTAPLLSACAEAQIAVLTVGDTHLPNGVLLPDLPHSRALKVMTAQLALTQPARKRLWQRIVQFKIRNQAAMLDRTDKGDDARRHAAPCRFSARGCELVPLIGHNQSVKLKLYIVSP